MALTPTEAVLHALVDQGVKAKLINIKLPNKSTGGQVIVVNSTIFLQVHKKWIFPAVTTCRFLEVNLEDENSIETLVHNLAECSKYNSCTECPVGTGKPGKELLKPEAMTAQEFGNTPLKHRARLISGPPKWRVQQEDKTRWGKIGEAPQS